MKKLLISVVCLLVLSACVKAVKHEAKAVKHEAVESKLPAIMVVDPHVVVAKCDHMSCARDVMMDDGLMLIFKYIDMDLGFTGYISLEELEPNIHPEDVSKDIPEEKNLITFIGRFYEILNEDPTKTEEHGKCEHHDEMHKDRELGI